MDVISRSKHWDLVNMSQRSQWLLIQCSRWACRRVADSGLNPFAYCPAPRGGPGISERGGLFQSARTSVLTDDLGILLTRGRHIGPDKILGTKRKSIPMAPMDFHSVLGLSV